MESLLGSSLWVFFGLTVVLAGGCAILSGQALAHSWKSRWQVWAYALLLAAGDRFLIFALFGGNLLSIQGFVVHAAVITLLADMAYQVTRARCMVTQYPWMFERHGPFSWREIRRTDDAAVS